MVSNDLLDQKGKVDVSSEQETDISQGPSTDTQAAVDLFSADASFGQSQSRDVELDSPSSEVLGSLEIAPEPAPLESTVAQQLQSPSAIELACQAAGLDLGQFDIESTGFSEIVAGLGSHFSPELALHAEQLAKELESAFEGGRAIALLEQADFQAPLEPGSTRLLEQGIESFVALVGSKHLVEVGEGDESV